MTKKIIDSAFITHLDKRDLSDKEFVLLSPLVYRSALLGGEIVVPRGFASDGSSVPRLPIVFWIFGDKAHHESVIHDFLYRSFNHIVDVKKIIDGEPVIERVFVSRRLADDVFREAMKVRQEEKEGLITKQKKNIFVRTGMWLGVRFGGRGSYQTGPGRYQIVNI